jgi:phosphoglucosamine mutase
MDVFLFGPVPTPAVDADALHAGRSRHHDLRLAQSLPDNGIKIFGPDGFKLSDGQELEIEAMLDDAALMSVAAPEKIGRAKRIEDAQARYIEFAKRTYPKDMTLDGLRVVIDTANGAAYKVAPTALWELGAEVIQIGHEPNGLNINDECGSTHPQAMCAKVKELRADIGIALDGDADRVIIADDKGRVVDGDQLMALIASSWAKRGELRGGGLVATIMSNLGLERFPG